MIRNRAFPLACSLLLFAPLALAQTPDGPGPNGPPPGGPAGLHRGPGPEGFHGQGLGILPRGTFWRNPDTVKAISLSADQQKQMDSIFLENRTQLIQMRASLEEEQLKLEPLLKANPLDQSAAFAEISRIADMRANLEKADARMLLSLRGVLNADQWTRLQTDRSLHRDSQDGFRGRRGPDGPPQPAGAPAGPGAGLE
jgi:Spy/CpxP family protein refolding chaperone